MDDQQESQNVEDVRGAGGFQFRPAHGIGLGTLAVALIGGSHHVQNLLGVAGRGDADRGANGQSVRLEQQADCYAGVWANLSQDEHGWRLEPGDIETALNAASQIGDDTLQRRSAGVVVPDSFTHGTSAQRVAWFKRGFESGSTDRCDTFAAASL